MCLNITTKIQPKPASTQIVYKVIRKLGKYTWDSSAFAYAWKSPRKNKTFESNRFGTDLTDTEVETRNIERGFHVFVSYKEAAAYLIVQRTMPYYRLVAFKAHPKYFVARGTNNGETNGAVYTRLTWHKVYRKHELKKLK
tara:strand:+ start:215 stop:634 length:420 start_codon:yes stop_codon:yes gene_type:complete